MRSSYKGRLRSRRAAPGWSLLLVRFIVEVLGWLDLAASLREHGFGPMIEFLEEWGLWISLVGFVWLLIVAFWPSGDEDDALDVAHDASASSHHGPAATVVSSPGATLDQSVDLSRQINAQNYYENPSAPTPSEMEREKLREQFLDRFGSARVAILHRKSIQPTPDSGVLGVINWIWDAEMRSLLGYGLGRAHAVEFSFANGFLDTQVSLSSEESLCRGYEHATRVQERVESGTLSLRGDWRPGTHETSTAFVKGVGIGWGILYRHWRQLVDFDAMPDEKMLRDVWVWTDALAFLFSVFEAEQSENFKRPVADPVYWGELDDEDAKKGALVRLLVKTLRPLGRFLVSRDYFQDPEDLDSRVL